MTTFARTPAPAGPENRKPIHGYVTDAAHDHWHGFAAENACSVSALLEAMGPTLSFDGPEAGATFTQQLHYWVMAARRIDTARRRRKP